MMLSVRRETRLADTGWFELLAISLEENCSLIYGMLLHERSCANENCKVFDFDMI